MSIKRLIDIVADRRARDIRLDHLWGMAGRRDDAEVLRQVIEQVQIDARRLDRIEDALHLQEEEEETKP